jgi:hypothetical protein
MASLSTAALAHSGKIPPLFAVVDMGIADRNEREGVAWYSAAAGASVRIQPRTCSFIRLGVRVIGALVVSATLHMVLSGARRYALTITPTRWHGLCGAAPGGHRC